jgi:NADPH2 dehydrogenase
MLYLPYEINGKVLKNKIIMAPMCMYMAENDGKANLFHTIHYGMHAMGGVSVVLVEATAVSEEGRISVNDLGIWSDEHIEGLKTIAKSIQQNGAVAGIQINHAGRKARTSLKLAPSKVAYEQDELPVEMTLEMIEKVIQDFKDAAVRANEAGFDWLEIHAAHGYLISQFMSPLSNLRQDQYGLKGQFLKEILKAILNVWPSNKWLSIRVSATEYDPNGFDVHDVITMLNDMDTSRVDLIHVSSGGNVKPNITPEAGYQLKFANDIKEAGYRTIGGGLITTHQEAEHALKSGQCDLVFFGRLLLRDPFYFLRNSDTIEWPKPYLRGK